MEKQLLTLLRGTWHPLHYSMEWISHPEANIAHIHYVCFFHSQILNISNQNKKLKDAHQRGAANNLFVIEGLDINWGWTPHRATHVLPQGTIAIKYNLWKDKSDKKKKVWIFATLC